MEEQSLEYRLLDPMGAVDDRTKVSILYQVQAFVEHMNFKVHRDDPKRIVVDNNAISMMMPTSKMITVAGYVHGGNALYLYSHTPMPSLITFPLQKPLEQMTRKELEALVMQEQPTIQKSYDTSFNPQLLIRLHDYTLDTLEQPE